jgi:hypothetical protein
MLCDTVKVTNPRPGKAYRIINATDYDPAVHTLYEPDEAHEPKPKPKVGRARK